MKIRMIKEQSSIVSRKDFIAKTGVALAGIVASSSSFGMASTLNYRSTENNLTQSQNSLTTLKKGQKFNESILFADKLTGRTTRRLTQYRPVNMTPSYHLNTCFSAENSYMILLTLFEDGGGALLRAETATGDITVIEVIPQSEEKNTNTSFAFIQTTGTEAVVIDNSLKIYNLNTFEERVILKDAQGLSLTAASIDGKKLYVKRRGDPLEVDGATTRPVTHLSVDVATSEIREILTETKAQCEHVVPCPTDPDLLLIDRDLPNRNDNGRTTRVWILNIKTRKLTEIRPNDSNRWAIHSNWSYNGNHVYYHGISVPPHPASPTGHYLGVADKSGKVVWEGHFPTFFYGHLATHTRADIIITDGLFTKNLITAIHWQELNSQNIPRIEIFAQHDTSWAPFLESHPHPHMSPDGKWLSYNRGESIGQVNGAGNNDPAKIKRPYGVATGNRSDVFVVEL